MAFTNDPNFEDDFRKVGPDATASLEPTNSPSNPTEYASSENIEVAGAVDEDDDLEDDEDLDDDEDEDDDLDDEDLEDDDEDEEETVDEPEDEDDLDEDDDDEDVDEDDEEADDELEGNEDGVKARLTDAERTARAR